MALGERLKDARKALNITQSKLAELINTSSSYISETLIALRNQLNISLDWLLIGEGEMFINDSNSAPSTYKIPYFTQINAAAGHGAFIHNEITEYIHFTKHFINNILHAQASNLNIINITGDSMFPTLQSSDLIMIDRSINSIIKDGIYIFTTDETLKVKRLQLIDKNTVIVSSDNMLYKSYNLNVEDIIIIGMAIWYGRKLA